MTPAEKEKQIRAEVFALQDPRLPTRYQKTTALAGGETVTSQARRKAKALGIPSRFTVGMPEFDDPAFLGFEMSDEQLSEIEHETIAAPAHRESRCLPSDFKDLDGNVRYYKAMMVNLYCEYGGNWTKVFKDKRSVSNRTLALYWADENFRARIHALDPVLTLAARGVVVEIMEDPNVDEKVRLAAALRWLEYADGENWDKGIRRQRIANKGSIATALMKNVSDQEYLEVFARDRLNKLPDDARKAILDALGTNQAQSIDTLPSIEQNGIASPTDIRVVDISKLKDPFEDINDETSSD